MTLAPRNSNDARSKFLWLAGVSAVLLAVLVGVLLYLSYSKILDNGKHLVESHAFVMEQQTARIFDSTNKRLELTHIQLAQLKANGQLTQDAVRQALQDQLKRQPYLRDIWVLDNNGQVVFDTHPDTAGLDLQNRGFFTAHQRLPAPDFYVDAPVISLRTGKWQLTASRAWRNQEGELLGVVAASFDLEFLAALWRSTDLGNDGSVALLRNDGVLLARSPIVASGMGSNLSQRPLFTQHLAKAPKGWYEDASAVDGITRIFGYQSLGDELNMVLVVGLSRQELLTQWTELAFIAAISGLLACVVIFFLAKSLLRAQSQHSDANYQLHILARAIASVSQGVVITDATKNITSVNSAFETMTGYSAEELVGRSCALLQGPESDPGVVLKMREALKAQRSFSGVLLNYRRDGSTFWNEISLDPICNESGQISHFIGVQRDVTLHKTHQLQTRLTEQIFFQASEGITVTDANGVIQRVNTAFTSITGYTAEEVVGRNPRILASGLQDKAYYDSMWRDITERGVWAGEIFNRHKNGTVYPEWLTISALRDVNGKVTHYLGSFTDLSSIKAADHRIQKLSHFDQLTGLPNSTLLQDRTEHGISLVQRSKEPLHMLLVSIDQFKQINDTLGHLVGDRMLVEVAHRLANAVRDQDTVSHQAGKEFTLLLPGTPHAGAAHLASELLWKLAQPYTIGNQEITVTACIGLSAFPENGEDFDSLFKSAEVALHRAQGAGRDNFKFYDEGMYQQVLHRDRLSRLLRLAQENGELSVVYQPFGDLQTGQISGMEALLRWNNPEMGPVSPAVFIPIAEEAGYIRKMGDWVIRRVASDIRSWLSDGITVPTVAINVSPIQFHYDDFVQSVKSALDAHGIEPERVQLEVTESALMDNVERCEEILHSLKRLGFGLSLDDFGTGYSSLSYLKRYPFDKVKIDQSFVRDISSNQTDTVIVKVIVSMAHGLGLKVIAEGVETEAQCEIMRTNVCDEIQGFFFSKPVDAVAFKALLQERKSLPDHLLRFRQRQRSLLLVDDEPNVLASLKRLFRRDGYTILTAASGSEGLAILAAQKVDIIISDQRMPGMTGVEFLRQAKQQHPDTIRIVLSGYTELQSVTDAINEGAIYRFLTKPWEDEQLREQILKAFEHKELLEENQQLDIKIRTTNQELVAANRHLGAVIHSTRQQIEVESTSLAVIREALQLIPTPVLGVDDESVIVFANTAAESAFGSSFPIWGEELARVSPALFALMGHHAEGIAHHFSIGSFDSDVRWNAMGKLSQSRGRLITFYPTGLSQ